MKGGIFITFEGVEGAGKTTQIQRVARWLRGGGLAVVITREPGGTPLANGIRDILLSPKSKGIHPYLELLLYEGARKDHVERVIRPALKKGAVVLCDRFIDATLAYQGYGRGLPLPFIRSLNHTATGGLFPDLTFLLNLPAKKGLVRKRNRWRRGDRLEREPLSFHQKVRKGYLTLASREKKRFRVVDASQGKEEIFRKIIDELKRFL